MRAFETVIAFSLVLGLCIAQGLDPAYLQQYYQQIASQAGQRAAANTNNPEATPIFETNSDLSQSYHLGGQPQQIRIKDNAQDQARAQQQQSPQHTQAYIAPSVRQYLQQPQPQQIQYVQQPQAQQIAYKPVPQPPKQQLLRRPQEYSAPAGKIQDKEDPEDYDPSPSYQFGFDVKDDEFTNYQNRKEVRDGNVVKGSYSVVDADGFIRTVKYTADPKEGFKAEVIREPTDIVIKFPTPAPHTNQLSAGPQQQYVRSQPSPVQYRQENQQPQYRQEQQKYRQEKPSQPQSQYYQQ